MSPSKLKPDDIVDLIKNETKASKGLICLNSIIQKSTPKDLNEFSIQSGIFSEKEVYSKTGYLLNLALFYYEEYHNREDLQVNYENTLELMGYSLLTDDIFKKKLMDYDFLSKRELIDVFSDFCADLGISVFDATKTMRYSLDLYLTRKTPLLRTEAVIVRTGMELSDRNYSDVLQLLENASEIAVWRVFVTTPYGVLRIGLKRLIQDMEKLNTWLYVVDPIYMRIFGITKGKKSKGFKERLRDEYISQLPHKSIRSPSQVVKISKYYFSESESYKPSDFAIFELIAKNEFEQLPVHEEHVEEPRYSEIFKNVMIIDKETGISILNNSSKTQPVREDLISGFLSAMDSFVAELGGVASMESIDYKGFFIQAAYGRFVKLALFISEPADQILKERTSFFINYFEEIFQHQIHEFRKTGAVSIFDKEEFETLARKILLI
jgi:hypothetical protein